VNYNKVENHSCKAIRNNQLKTELTFTVVAKTSLVIFESRIRHRDWSVGKSNVWCEAL